MTEAAEEPRKSFSRAADRERPPRGTVPVASGAVGACPACGGPLYGWTHAPASDARKHETYVLDRCESCGLAIVREGELDVDVLLASARARPDGLAEVSLPNRRSLQALIGGATWAALDLPQTQFAATPKALVAVLERAGCKPTQIRQPPWGPNLLWMGQTLLNAVTFHPNFAREALAGRLRPATARSRGTLVIDGVVSVLALPFAAIAAVVAETLASGLRRGGRLVAVIDPSPGQASPSSSSASSGAESS